jgi:hypothetical protein
MDRSYHYAVNPDSGSRANGTPRANLGKRTEKLSRRGNQSALSVVMFFTVGTRVAAASTIGTARQIA